MPLDDELRALLNTTYCEIFEFSGTKTYRNGTATPRSPYDIIVLQVILINLFKTFFELILNPFGQTNFVPRMLSGISLGPSFLGKKQKFRSTFLYSPKGIMVIDIFEALGFMFYIFLISVRLDSGIAKKSGKLGIVIGITSFVFPMLITTTVAFFLRKFIEMEPDLHRSLPLVGIMSSITSFHVILPLLTEMKYLNSELGRLAMSASMVSGISSWVLVSAIVNVRDGVRIPTKEGMILTVGTKIAMIIIIIWGLRPIILWLRKRSPDGKFMKETHIFAIVLMVIGCALLGEFTGQHFYFGPVVLGMATPEGPPIGYSLLEKIECFVDSVLMPTFTLDIGRRIDLSRVKMVELAIVELLMSLATLVKFAAIMIPSLYYRLPLTDAFSLGLILSCKGLFDIQHFLRFDRIRMLTRGTFIIMVVTSTLHTAVFTPLLKIFYDPTRRYVAYRGRSIQHTGWHMELRVLSCIHQEEDVHSIINLLEYSNPSRESPLFVCVLNLQEAAPGGLPLIISHQLNRCPSYKASTMNHIINAFHQFEQQNHGLVAVQCFTSIAPYTTMHDDVCSMALEKGSALVILMFSQSDKPSVRMLNKNVLRQASCSVGILFKRGSLRKNSFLSRPPKMNVLVVFIGGADDREALAFGIRMSAHPSITLTVLRLISQDIITADLDDQECDMITINDFKRGMSDNINFKYMEEHIMVGTQTAKLLGSASNDYDLISVGRRHDPNCSVLRGLSEWSEDEEMGVIGDILVSLHCKASVFVLQKQASVVEGMIEKPGSILKMMTLKRRSITGIPFFRTSD